MPATVILFLNYACKVNYWWSLYYSLNYFGIMGTGLSLITRQHNYFICTCNIANEQCSQLLSSFDFLCVFQLFVHPLKVLYIILRTFQQ